MTSTRSPTLTPSRFFTFSTLKVKLRPAPVVTVTEGTFMSMPLSVTISVICREMVPPGLSPGRARHCGGGGGRSGGTGRVDLVNHRLVVHKRDLVAYLERLKALHLRPHQSFGVACGISERHEARFAVDGFDHERLGDGGSLCHRLLSHDRATGDHKSCGENEGSQQSSDIQSG